MDAILAWDADGALSTGDNTNTAFSSATPEVGEIACIEVAPPQGKYHPDWYPVVVDDDHVPSPNIGIATSEDGPFTPGTMGYGEFSGRAKLWFKALGPCSHPVLRRDYAGFLVAPALSGDAGAHAGAVGAAAQVTPESGRAGSRGGASGEAGLDVPPPVGGKAGSGDGATGSAIDAFPVSGGAGSKAGAVVSLSMYDDFTDGIRGDIWDDSTVNGAQITEANGIMTVDGYGDGTTPAAGGIAVSRLRVPVLRTIPGTFVFDAIQQSGDSFTTLLALGFNIANATTGYTDPGYVFLIQLFPTGYASTPKQVQMRYYPTSSPQYLVNGAWQGTAGQLPTGSDKFELEAGNILRTSIEMQPTVNGGQVVYTVSRRAAGSQVCTTGGIVIPYSSLRQAANGTDALYFYAMDNATTSKRKAQLDVVSYTV